MTDMAGPVAVLPRHFERRSACPGCGSERAHTIHRAPYAADPIFPFLQRYYSGRVPRGRLEDAEYVLDRCDDCSLVFQRFIPSADFLDEVYDRWLNSDHNPETDPVFIDAVKYPARCRDGHEIFAIAAALGKPPAELRVLDYGMGWGMWARVARGLGCEVYGFDLSAARRDFAREHSVRIVDTNELRGLELDFVNTEQVFEHLTTPLADAQALSTALRPGGIFKVAVPRADDIEQRLQPPNWDAPRSSRRSLNAVHPLEHLNCWNPHALATMARRAGMEPFPVPLSAYFAFLRIPGALPRGPKQLAKSFVRPAYHRFAPHQLYRWFRKPGSAG